MMRFAGTVALFSILASQLWIGGYPAFSEIATKAQTVTNPELVPGKVIVKYKQPIRYNSRIRSVSPLVSEDRNVKTIDLPVEQNVWSKVEELNKDPNVEFAQPVYVYRLNEAPLAAQTPVPAPVQPGASTLSTSAVAMSNDPASSLQWGLSVTEATYAWKEVTVEERSRVKIAIVDTGVNINHLDLADSIDRVNGQVNGYDFINNDADPNDDNGHGTHVSGIAAAIADNGQGIAGMAGGAKIIPVKVANQNGAGDTLTIASGIKWAVDHGASVINLSMTRERFQKDAAGHIVIVARGKPVIASDKIESEAIQYAIDHQVLVVAASGNDSNHWIGKDMFNLDNPTGDTERYYAFTGFPAAIDGVVSVGAVDYIARTGKLENDIKLADFSNIGFVSVAAPGVDIWSTVPGGYKYNSGTSMAAPFVTGLAALIKAANPALSKDELQTILTDSAVHLPDPGVGTYNNGYRPSVKDDYGSGLINGRRALNLPRLQVQFAPVAPSANISNSAASAEAQNAGVVLTATDKHGTVTEMTYGLSAGLSISKLHFTSGLWTQDAVQSVPMYHGKGILTLPSAYGRYKIVADDGLEQEFIRSNTITYEKLPDAPEADHASSSLPVGTEIKLSSAVSGASIYYTLDGTAPTPSSRLYGGAIVLDHPGAVQLKAVAVSNDTESQLREVQYMVTSSASPLTSPAPSVSPTPVAPGGGFGGGPILAPPLPTVIPLTDQKMVETAPSGEIKTIVEVSKERIDHELAVTSGPITIDASTANGNENVDVILGASTREALNKADRTLIIRSDRVRLEVPRAALKGTSGAGDWKLSIAVAAAPAFPLSSSQGINTVLGSYQFEISDTNKAVASFPDPIRVTFAVEPSQIHDSTNVGVYGWNPSARSWEYAGGQVQPDGTVAFHARHFSQYAVMERSSAFADLAGHWAKASIERMAGRGITNGVTDVQFDPQGTLTRAQFAALLARTLQLKEAGANRPFTDVPSNAWYYEAVYQVFAANIVSGMTDTSFRPNDPITREQMAIMLTKAVANKSQQSNSLSSELYTFKDHASVSPWAQDNVKLASKLGLLEGFPDGTFPHWSERSELKLSLWLNA
ncbi:Serine protease, subtilisin family [Paenibacillus sp. GP183]|nr:Serine protease, subtilisin family [Paenibacillus sp. GP183]